MDQFKDGLAPDPRTPEQKAKDFIHSDVAGDVILSWREKEQNDWKKYVPREQDGSLSCCGQASAKAVEILTGQVMSAHPPYRARSNYPAGGMYLQNVGQVWKTTGSTTELLDSSQFKNEQYMNRDITVPTPTKMLGEYRFVDPRDIDEIAEAIELHGHCILIFHCNKKEWTSVPIYDADQPINFGHCVCAVDYFLKNGEKVILIEDSTGHFNSISPEKTGQRLITSNFLINRCSGAMYLSPKASYVFTKTLRKGMFSEDVKQLQRVLGVIQTGYFGSMTLKAVKSFQASHGLVSDGVVGPKTNAELNKL